MTSFSMVALVMINTSNFRTWHEIWVSVVHSPSSSDAEVLECDIPFHGHRLQKKRERPAGEILEFHTWFPSCVPWQFHL